MKWSKTQGTNVRLALNLLLTALGALSIAAESANGPLRVATVDPRYFTEGGGKAIYLTGSHTWANLQDIGLTNPPSAFDFAAYLDFLESHHHNFIRLWRWEFPQWTERDKQRPFSIPAHGLCLVPGAFWQLARFERDC
ncbi:MAG TPA: hypothetical protein VJA21_15815 [Verrucomicrobiae bacterium]